MRLRADEVVTGHRIVGGTVVWTSATPDGKYVYISVEELTGGRTTTTCWHSTDELQVEGPPEPWPPESRA